MTDTTTPDPAVEPPTAVRRDPADPTTWALPTRLSPSRASDFRQCPRKFFYRSVVGLAEPPTQATITGTVVHTVCERVFDRDRADRTIDAALELLPAALAEGLARADVAEQVELGTIDPELLERRAAELVENWFAMEDPTRWDPAGRELRLNAVLGGVPVVGVIDRLDRLEATAGERVFISDYKTGKVPSARYRTKAFAAMKIYALLAEELLDVVPETLRLVYLSAGHPSGILTMPVTRTVLTRTRNELAGTWDEIVTAATTGVWPTRTGPLCNWCPYQSGLCPAFTPGIDAMEGIPAPVPLPAP